MALHRVSSPAVLAVLLLAAGSALTGCSGSSSSDAPDSDHGGGSRDRTTATYHAVADGSVPSGDMMRHTADLLGHRAKGLGIDGATFTVHGATITAQAPGHRTSDLRELAATADLTFRPVLDAALPGAASASPPPGAASAPAALRTAYSALTCHASSASPSAVARPSAPPPAPARDTVACDDQRGEKFLLAPAALTGTDVERATSVLDRNGGGWMVDLSFTSAGSRRFAKVTGTLAEQVDPANRFAILLDDRVLSAPAVQQSIAGGAAQISGGFDQDSARDLAAFIDGGSLPVELTVVEVSEQ